MTPTKIQIDAASKAARDELAAISGWINYNDQISDEQMVVVITKILTAALNASPTGKGK